MRAALLALLLAGCSLPVREVPIEVRVPIPVARTPPPELVACTEDLRRPVFSDCSGVSCLTPEQEQVFAALIDELLRCDRAWRAWSVKK